MKQIAKKLEKYVAVSGLPGLYLLADTRKNGLILKDLDNGKSKFISMRNHQFTPLGTVAIYTIDDTEELSKVFRKMQEQEIDNPPPPHNSDASVLFEYFEDVVPFFDKDKVFLSDIKKVIKWYSILKEEGVFEPGGSDEEE